MAPPRPGGGAVVLRVEGMMCQQNCGSTVMKALQRVPGAELVVVSFPLQAALVTGAAAAGELVEAVEMVGFDASVVSDPARRDALAEALNARPAGAGGAAPAAAPARASVVLHVEGMMCQTNCGSTVRSALQRVPGAERVIVSFPQQAALVEGTAAASELVEAVEMVGFDCSEASPGAARAALAASLEAFANESSLSPAAAAASASASASASAAALSPSAPAAVAAGAAPAARPGSPLSRLYVPDQRQVQRASSISLLDDDVSGGAEQGNSLDEGTAIPVAAAPGAPDAPGRRRRCEVQISGMTCTACVSNVEGNVRKVDGVYSIAVALIAEKASIEYDAAKVSGQDLANAVTRLGYKGTLVEDDMACNAGVQGVGSLTLLLECSAPDLEASLLEPLRSLDGVLSAELRAAAGGGGAAAAAADQPPPGQRQLVIKHMQDTVGARDLVEFVRRSGFSCELGLSSALAGKDEQSQEYARLFFSSLLFTVPVIFLSMVCPYIPPIMEQLVKPTGLGIDWHSLLLWVLATPVQFYFGARFYRNAANALRHGTANMDVLVALGTSAAYLYSMVSLLVSMVAHAANGGADSATGGGSMGIAMHQGAQGTMMGGGSSSSSSSSSSGGGGDHSMMMQGGDHAMTVSSEASMDAHFFETSAMLVTFILMGKYLESSARGRTADAIAALMDLQVQTATLVLSGPEGDTAAEQQQQRRQQRSNWRPAPQSPSGRPEEQEVDLRLVQVGDILKVPPGARVPVDGVVTYGRSAVDEAMLTGEAAPVSKEPGSPVTGSTINGHGMLFMRATRVGSDTTLAQIMKLVEDAQTSKAPIQEYADRIAKYFVPVVVLLALLTWGVWFAVAFCLSPPPAYLRDARESERLVFVFKFGVAVLVISCPCALGLATPTAVMVATGVGARLGVLIKGGEALESGSKVTAVVFDKTGTITQGKPVVSELLCERGGGSEHELLVLLAQAERQSEHPVAKAVVARAAAALRGELAERAARTPLAFEALPGLGVDATLADGTRVIVGNRKLLKLNGAHTTPRLDRFLAQNEAQGTVVLAASYDAARAAWTLEGALAVCDPINENASYVVSLLRTMRIKVYMLSGDNTTTAHAVAKQCGIPPECVFANCLPKQKSNRIAKLQEAGEVVAMVGDGINDSPALTLADLGIAVGAGTDVAIKAADVVLIRSNLADVPVFIDLARKTIRRIWLNLFLSVSAGPACCGNKRWRADLEAASQCKPANTRAALSLVAQSSSRTTSPASLSRLGCSTPRCTCGSRPPSRGSS
jgi:Cu+-exporting ATPase